MNTNISILAQPSGILMYKDRNPFSYHQKFIIPRSTAFSFICLILPANQIRFEEKRGMARGQIFCC